jgi:hypothetical protein
MKEYFLMQAFRLIVTWLFLLALICIGPQRFQLAQVVRQSSNNKETSESLPIRLVLQTSKENYRAGEPITITSYLENLSDKSYYVGNNLVSFWGSVGLHDIRLKIVNKSGQEMVIGRGAGDWIWKPGTTTIEKLAQAYVQLKPKTIHGLTDTTTLSPGQYRLTAVYREIEALNWDEAERKALAVPVWTQPIVSNTVSITISR